VVLVKQSSLYCDDGDVLFSVQSVDFCYSSNHTGNIKYVDRIILNES
jgi:hypothetical protein